VSKRRAFQRHKTKPLCRVCRVCWVHLGTTEKACGPLLSGSAITLRGSPAPSTRSASRLRARCRLDREHCSKQELPSSRTSDVARAKKIEFINEFSPATQSHNDRGRTRFSSKPSLHPSRRRLPDNADDRLSDMQDDRPSFSVAAQTMAYPKSR
jgi:hypothetical protein